ncbi:MAG: helix-turn-helix domain-containing protein [Clostridia bacterium]|nr:helix-turn-helix domain-containing protein [Clostridia bacterium]
MNEEIYLCDPSLQMKRAADVLMAGISYCDKTYCIERPDYDCYVIEYTVDGEGILEVDGHEYNVCGGDVYFLYKGKAHKYYCKGESWTKLWVVVYGELADALFNSYLTARPDLIHGLSVEGHMRRIIETVRNKELSYDETVDRVMLTVHEILQAARWQIGKLPQRHKSLPQEIKNYIDASLKKPLSLDGLAALFYYSKNHIINVFRKEYKITPYVYYERQRISAAARLLRNTDLTVGEIAREFGFENVQCFSKCFKKHFSVTPVKYRRP